ncbi:MAG: hypothetical protein LBT84_01205 [Spirochaetia bacterium]|jgi:hypothetical protein|nr:hypothetical protein [Spirochaetia bacterium]
MIIPFDKLMKYAGNKYVFTRATMLAVDKIANIRDYPEEHLNWKVVPNILKAMLDEDVKFSFDPVEAAEKNTNSRG